MMLLISDLDVIVSPAPGDVTSLQLRPPPGQGHISRCLVTRPVSSDHGGPGGQVRSGGHREEDPCQDLTDMDRAGVKISPRTNFMAVFLFLSRADISGLKISRLLFLSEL